MKVLRRNSIKQTSDGGYIVAGGKQAFVGSYYYDFWVIKLDSNGNKMWDKIFSKIKYDDVAYSIQQTSDGGYIVAGSTDYFDLVDGWVIKLDNNGNEIWDKTFGKSGAFLDTIYSIQQTSDGGYVFAGKTQTYEDATLDDMWVVKLDDNGNILWDKIIGESDIDEEVRSIQQTKDGGYIVTGVTFWVVKLDNNGNKIWDKTFDGGSEGIGISFSIRQTTDEGYIVAGWTKLYEETWSDIWVVKLDNNGNKIWDKTFDGKYGAAAYSVQQTTDGGYVVAGYTALDVTGEDFRVIKMDANGNTECE
jgi:hypothetical protein